MKILAFLIAIPAFLFGGVIHHESNCRYTGSGNLCSFEMGFHETTQKRNVYEESGADWHSWSQHDLTRTTDSLVKGEHFSSPDNGFGFTVIEESIFVEDNFKSKFGTADGFTQTNKVMLTEHTFNYSIIWNEWSCVGIQCKMLENRFTTSTTFFSEASEWVSYFLGNLTDSGVNLGRWSDGPFDLQTSWTAEWSRDSASPVPEPKTNSLFVFGGILMAVGLHMRKK